jgi:signal transduction histidine kinase/iron only hydrogenase large subunit-like protein
VKQPTLEPLICTIKERCRVCYTCVRECPAKAIRITSGQAAVIVERCIGCGNCVAVCSQKAKHVRSTTGDVAALLAGPHPVAACVAPSFPAEFPELSPGRLVGLLRALGFARVNEVSFGADLVADRYRRLFDGDPDGRYIASTCPAMVAYVERYHPDAVPALAPIVSPMVATARVLRRVHGDDLRIVFIGPCIAKKAEADSRAMAGEIDAALTFAEIRQMITDAGLDPAAVESTDFDPPRGGLGALFPISRGLLQAARIQEDLVDGDIVVADGRRNFVEAICEFESGDMQARLLEVLCCKGCIVGPGMTSEAPLFKRREQVSRYVRDRWNTLNEGAVRAEVDHFADLPLGRTFAADDQRFVAPSRGEMADILRRMGKESRQDELDCGACGYDTCLAHAIAIDKGLAESEMCLPYTIDQLKRTVGELAVSNTQLATAQEALMHSERLASMGQLAAGIAHEVNNPLGVVLMYTHLLLDEHGATDIPGDARLREDLAVIVEQTDRCKKIVAGLLNFARQNKVALAPTDVRKLVDLSLRVLVPATDVAVLSIHDEVDPVAELDGDQITQVLTNLVENAYAAMPKGGTLTVRTGGDDARVTITVADTGVGIARENLGKVFEPFFTTKQIGKGTGLGLAVSYGIIKMHRGDLEVASNADPDAGPTGTTFTITIPRKGQQD